MSNREYTPLDHLILGFDRVAGALDTGSRRPSPAGGLPDVPMQGAEMRHSAALMRVNHAGEVAAQALYAGHALAARDTAVRESMLQAAAEEGDHLHWCESRVRELGSRVSYLAPAWYFGSFAIGEAAGRPGENEISAFVMENRAPRGGNLTGTGPAAGTGPEERAVVQQCADAEQQHASTARAAGAAELPRPLQFLMRCCAKVMTGSAYWL